MSQEVKQIRIQQKVDTKERWEQNNPRLLNKEIGYEKETGRYKIGDGINLWKNLPYAGEEIDNKILAMEEEKADKEFVVSIFEQLKALIEAGKTDEVIAVLDEAIFDLAVLA